MEQESITSSAHSQEKSARESLMDVEVPTPRPTTLRKETREIPLFEQFVTFSINHLEAPEREGRLPEVYSNLDLAELHGSYWLLQRPNSLSFKDL